MTTKRTRKWEIWAENFNQLLTKFERVLEQKQKLISLRKRTIGNREIIQRINVFQVYQNVIDK